LRGACPVAAQRRVAGLSRSAQQTSGRDWMPC
jgi:hypothetical protein